MKNIAAKLVKVMEECRAIPKNGTNSFHHYKYTTSADVMEKINTALVKQNLISIVIPELINSMEVLTAKGTTEHLVTVKTDITLIDSESGEELHLCGLGSGQDGGDKAVMKAQTAAIKYAYMLSFAISSTDDPEADPKTDENTTIPQASNGVATLPLTCSDCPSKITTGIQNVSMNKYGRPLCIKCQKKLQNVA